MEDIKHHSKWREFWLCNRDPELLWEITENIILECANHHCPSKRMEIRGNSPSWLTREIIEELYYKDDLYKLHRKRM